MLVSPLSSFCRQLHRTASAPTDKFLTEGRHRADRYWLTQCTAQLEKCIHVLRKSAVAYGMLAVQMAGAGTLLWSASTYPAILQVSAGRCHAAGRHNPIAHAIAFFLDWQSP